MRALISVSDKTGITELAKRLESFGWEIISTGGTFNSIKQSGVKVTEVSYVTGFPECLDGRVKTLHPKIHAGILAKRDNAEHMEFINEYSIGTIDMVIVNLYPFKKTIADKNATFDDAVENIDIGGPTMLRSAAKNFEFVVVVTDPEDYDAILDELEKNGDVSKQTRLYLAAKVFEHTAHYDALIAEYLSKKAGLDSFGKTLTLTYEKRIDMRYGENPHQAAAFYSEIGASGGGLSNALKLQGKELSFNNINDSHGAIELCREFDEPAFVACKHSNPCGVGCADNIFDAYQKAYNADPVSIYGGVLAANREIDEATAIEISKIFVEIIIAPSFSDGALNVFKKKKNLRLLKLDISRREGTPDIKKVSGGILIQGLDNTLFESDMLKTVTKRQPTQAELDDLIFSMKVVKHTKSNAIVLGSRKQSIGIGAGQVCRIWACKQAIEHANEFFGQEHLKSSVLASDAFFPFSDCVEAAAEAGIKAIMQPGGSIKDQESIDACDKYGIAMVFTGMRHFRH